MPTDPLTPLLRVEDRAAEQSIPINAAQVMPLQGMLDLASCSSSIQSQYAVRVPDLLNGRRDAEMSWVEIDELRSSNVGRLFLRASRHYGEAAIAEVRRRGHDRLTLAHTSVLPHIDRDGSRLTEIADRAGITKQSASELVVGLERLGYLRRVKDQSDKRAHLLVFTERGEDFLRAAFEAKQALEEEMTRKLGPESAKELIRLLVRYLA